MVQARTSKGHQGWVCPGRHCDPKHKSLLTLFQRGPKSLSALSLPPLSCFSVLACVKSHMELSLASKPCLGCLLPEQTFPPPPPGTLSAVLASLVSTSRITSLTPYCYKRCPHRKCSPQEYPPRKPTWQTPRPSKLSSSNTFAVKPSLGVLSFC